MTVVKTSSLAKKLPLKSQQALCEFIRKNISPEIDYPEWLQIEKDISETKKNVNQYMMQGLMTSLGKGEEMPSEVQRMFQSEVRKLDESVRDQMKEIDLKAIQKKVDPVIMKKLNAIFNLVLKDKKDYEDKK